MATSRGVDMPVDLRAALRAVPGAETAFDRLPPSHRREYVAWIDEAKQPSTRARRISETVERLLGAPGPTRV